MAQPVMYFEMIAKDPKKLKAFYTNLFGWRVEDYQEMNYAMMHADPNKGISGGISGLLCATRGIARRAGSENH